MNLFRYCGDDPVDDSDPFGLEFRGDEIRISEVPTLTFRVEGEAYGATRFLVDPYVQPIAVSGGYGITQTGLDITITNREVATTVQVKGERYARARTPAQIAATKVHEGGHKDLAKEFDKANQHRSFPSVYKTKEEAQKAAAEAVHTIRRDFGQEQKKLHDQIQDTIKKESFR